MPTCETCNKYIKSLGIARHRAMHRDKKERCVIRFFDRVQTCYYDLTQEEYNAQQAIQDNKEK